LARFNPSVANLCLPFGPDESPVTEQWKLVPLSTENHNCHLHQTRFTAERQRRRGSGHLPARRGVA
jgi:hypothetical protein